jgi:hypothetical protein
MEIYKAVIISTSILSYSYLLSCSLTVFNAIYLDDELNDKNKKNIYILNGGVMFVTAISFGYLTYIATK